jgi:hypothetical protein
MNPFVNPKKRGITLPSGCKDLVDVLKRSESKQGGAVRRFIHLVLFQAQQDQATDLIVGVASPAGTPIRYKVGDAWYDLSPFPSHIRADFVSEVVRMAKFPAGQIPGGGVLDISFGEVRLRWVVAMTRAEGECTFVRIQD